MKFIGRKFNQICHNLLYLNILLCIFQVSALQADTGAQFEYINTSAEYAETTSGTRPRGITVTEDYIFVADAGKNAISIYKNDEEGKLLISHKGESTVDGIISYPYDIAYSEESNLLILMDQFSTYTRIVIYKLIENEDGSIALNYIAKTSIDDKLAGITIDDTRKFIWCLSSNGANIYKISNFETNSEAIDKGVYLLPTDGVENSFAGIDYYTDGSRSYLAISNPAGKNVIIYEIGDMIYLHRYLPLSSDSENISLGQPTDIDIWTTSSNQVLCVVTDRSNSCVDLFDFATGEFIMQLGNTGSSKAKLSLPYCSAGLDGTSTIYVADTNNRRIAAYSIDESIFADEEENPIGDPNVEIKFTAISMTNVVVSLVGPDPMGYYMLDCKEKLTDTWTPALQSNIYIPATQADFPITGNSFVGSNESFDISGTITEAGSSKEYSLDIPIDIFVKQNDAASIDSSFFQFRRIEQ